ncbi:MAG: carbamoyltransferase N-terminal domain-containing protein, partial [Pseudomonadota bacterium]
LREAGISISEVETLVYYEKPFLTFERLLETYVSQSPSGLISFMKAMPLWLKQKLGTRSIIRHEMRLALDAKKNNLPKIQFSYHHLSHAASAFFASPFEEAAVLCMDGVGEWSTASLWQGKGKDLQPLVEIEFPHSLGLLYSAFTYFCGFKVNSGEYKLMGLAPYGEPKYVNLIKSEIIDIKEDGSFRLNLDLFDYMVGLKMTNHRFEKLIGFSAREPETAIQQQYMDLAASIQQVTEEIVIKLAHSAKKKTGSSKLCLAGGVALNCVANGELLKEGIFDEIWVQPAAGDAGGALGAALAYWHIGLERDRIATREDIMSNSYLGPSFSTSEIESKLNTSGLQFEKLTDDQIPVEVAKLIEQQQVVGWFQGRMEYGPRALGSRSILADPRGQDMQHKVNRKIKFRESFRPLAPVVTEDRAGDIFEGCTSSPYMLLTYPVQKSHLKPVAEERLGLDQLNVERSRLGSITHVDGSARVQTIRRQDNPMYHQTLVEFEKLTGYPVAINTSFNVRGEPIVCNPDDAIRCFLNTDMDYLVIDHFLVRKQEHQRLAKPETNTSDFPLD